MKLILSLTLIWTISNTAETRQCYDSRQQFNRSVLRSCVSADELCATAASLEIFKEQRGQAFVRDCVPPSLCAAQNQTLSYSDADFTVAASVRCCKTDGCNSQDVPHPHPGQKNGRRCPTCSGRPDNTFTCGVVECVGEQDRCIDAVLENQGSVRPLQGCVSANVCELLSQLKVRSDVTALFGLSITPRVHGASFCSSACIVNPAVVSFLLGLLALFAF